MIRNGLQPPSIEKMEEDFKQMDANHDGVVTKDEMNTFLIN